MDSQKYVFHSVTALTAVAVGQPGHRTFYIVAGEGESWVRIWLEKEELVGLSSIIDEMLQTIVQGGHYTPLKDADREPEILFEPALQPAADFKLGRLALGYDEARDCIGLFAYSPDAQGDSPTVVCWVTRAQAFTLSERIDEVCASGRPICALCGGPIDPEGHVCPKSNGHGPRAL